MLKRLVSFLLIFSLIFGMGSVSLGAEKEIISLILNDIKILLEQDVYLNENGQLMVPLRQVVEEMNYQVLWNEIEKSIEFKNSSFIFCNQQKLFPRNRVRGKRNNP